MGVEHLIYEVKPAKARGLGAHERAAIFEALAGEHSAPVARELLVLPEEITYLAGAYADVAGRHINLGTDVAEQLAHEGLAEAHDLGIALAAGAEVRAALAAAHGQRGQCVLERLLEAKELQDREVNGGVEAQTALVRTDGRIELHAVAQVHLHLTFIIDPRHAEGDDALRFYEALYQLRLLKLWVLVVDFFNTHEHLAHGLQVLFLAWMFGLQVGHNRFNFH